MGNLEGKIIVVTGGSGLLGKAMVDDINSQNGIAINLDVNCEKNLEKGLYTCDITHEKSVSEAIEAVFKYFGRIDGLVNNAYPRTKDWGTDFMVESMDSWRENVDLQLNSHVYITKKVAPIMQAQKEGFIVNIASIYGVVGNDMSLYENTDINTVAGYSAIKGGLINLTKYWASYFGKDNIKVNCVSPGGIFDNQDPVFVERYNSKVPLGRMGTPQDIAPSVSFLLSDSAKYITGQNLIVDGGWTAI